MARRYDRPLAAHFRNPTLAARWSDKFLTGIEGALDEQDTINTDLAATQADLADALLAIKIGLSYPSGITITAADVGSNCTITISSHTRHYGDGTTLAISADTVTNRAFSTTYYLYYNDSSCADTTPNILSTTNPNNAVPNKTAGRHYVGEVTTPADGAAASDGDSASPPSYRGDTGLL